MSAKNTVARRVVTITTTVAVGDLRPARPRDLGQLGRHLFGRAARRRASGTSSRRPTPAPMTPASGITISSRRLADGRLVRLQLEPARNRAPWTTEERDARSPPAKYAGVARSGRAPSWVGATGDTSCSSPSSPALAGCAPSRLDDRGSSARRWPALASERRSARTASAASASAREVRRLFRRAFCGALSLCVFFDGHR